MKKFLTFGLITLCLTGCAFGTEAMKGYISVNTEAVEELNPTTVKISFSIETKANNAQTAAELNKKASQDAINAVKSLIDTDKKETMKTTSYNLNPEYSYKDRQSKLVGYRAYNTLQVTLKDTEKAGKVISTALSNGANSVSGLQFTLDDTNEACNKLLQEASKNARQRADKIAESMGTSVYGIKNISAGCSSNQGNHANFRVINAKAALGASDEGAGVMPVEAGKTQLRAYINADFYVK